MTEHLARDMGYNIPGDVSRHIDTVVSKYTGLKCTSAVFVHNNGKEEMLLSIEGTVPIYYHRHRYNIPVALWLPKSFPMTAPMCYVVPSPDMTIKASHACVDSTGRVTLPEIRNWSSKSRLLALVEEMSKRFSDAPPLFRKPTPKLRSSQSGASASRESPAVSKPAPRRASVSVDPMAKGLLPTATATVQSKLASVSTLYSKDINELFRQQSRLNDAASTLKTGLGELEAEHARVLATIPALDASSTALEEWLAVNEGVEADHAVWEVLVPTDTWSKQLLEACAEDYAIEDTMYMLDRALIEQSLTLEEFLKEIRKLSRKQFFARALAKKVDYTLKHEDLL